MRIKVLYHDHCFDGAASAAFFTRFYRERYAPDAEFAYAGLAHVASQTFDDALFDGDVNAIVDFKYSTNPKLNWWFDHHQSTFLSPEDAVHFRNSASETKMYDPSYRSCTKYISTVTRDKFGYDAPDLADLVRWADIIDGAQYANAQEAVELNAPAMKLTLLIESAKGSGVVQKIIGLMCRQTLDEIASEPSIQEAYAPLYERHLQSIGVIRQQAAASDGVVSFDLVGLNIEGYNKFIPYYLFPESVYTVSVSTSSFRTKVSVGSNPWVVETPRHNLATICERYGGGGHPRVGAISFPIGAVDEARKAAREIREELSS